MTWRQIVDRSEGHIARLAPGFKERVAKWYQELIMKKIPVLIYCSTRTPAEQDELFKKRPKVTNARGTPVCQSFHCYGRAVDAVPLAQSSTNGLTACWDDVKTYAVMSEIGEKYRLRTLSWETPHFEDADYKDWRELAGKTESENSPGISGGTKLVRKSSRLPLSTSRKVSLRKP
jgi:peptidoglycan L-alanyl-D-glutamate endopeptidase CwlK